MLSSGPRRAGVGYSTGSFSGIGLVRRLRAGVCVPAFFFCVSSFVVCATASSLFGMGSQALPVMMRLLRRTQAAAADVHAVGGVVVDAVGVIPVSLSSWSPM